MEVPRVEEEAVVPAVPTAPAPSQGETSEVVLDFTASTAVPLTTGDIQPAADDPEAQLAQGSEGYPPTVSPQTAGDLVQQNSDKKRKVGLH